MKKIFHFIINWARFRLFYHFTFLRPENIAIQGKLKIDFFSFISIDKKSHVNLGNGIQIRRSNINIKNSKVRLGDQSKINAASINFSDSEIEIDEQLIIDKTIVNISRQSVLKAGKHNMYTSENYYQSGLFITAGNVNFGTNVNIYAHSLCYSGIFTVGSNVFINPGTQIRCNKEITIGSNILISYECIIFDNNTHSLSHEDRYAEMKKGFPNKVEQDDEAKSKVKCAAIVLGDDVWIGMRSFVFKGSKIGNKVIAGAGSVIAGQEIPEGKKVFGNPLQIR